MGPVTMRFPRERDVEWKLERERARARARMVIAVLALAAAAALAVSCAPSSDAQLVPRNTLIVGVDVSGSFEKSGRYDDALAFAAHYIHGHLDGDGGLEQPRALFVGAIGGEKPGEPQSFHPIHDFQRKSVEEIEADLRRWFPPVDKLTDFNAFFQRAATLVKRQNLVLAPITLVLLTDGVPDLGRVDAAPDAPERYEQIDLKPLEFLARNVTVRVLYADPGVGVQWERSVPRDRVRMWTVDQVVMRGWREQLAMRAQEAPAAATAGEAAAASAGAPAAVADSAGEDATVGGAAVAEAESTDAAGADPSGAGPAGAASAGGSAAPAAAPTSSSPAPSPALVEAPEQTALWQWILDNVDFRVRRSVL